MELLKKEDYPDWLKKANIEDEIVYTDEYGDIYWMNGTWKGGIWKGGTWYGGTWQYGTWKDGTWKGGTWESGIWKGGAWYGGIWKGGTWEGGTWYSGIWKGGTWQYGTWESGIWYGGTWEDGTWLDGIWYGGDWLGGTWRYGTWESGIWKGGTWHGGIWERGTWQDSVITDRLLYMCVLIGIVFDENGYAKAYRTTNADHTQKEGYFEEPKAAPSESGTCCPGIHVTSMSTAVSYFGVDPTAVLWEVTFKREDLLDCDGQKARIRAGTAKIIKCPFMA